MPMAAALLSTSAMADFVGAHSSATETPYTITPWARLRVERLY
jgi:hypothetical protein